MHFNTLNYPRIKVFAEFNPLTWCSERSFEAVFHQYCEGLSSTPKYFQDLSSFNGGVNAARKLFGGGKTIEKGRNFPS